MTNQFPPLLQGLDVSQNKIAFLGEIHKLLPEISDLDLSSNRLISLDTLFQCTNLQFLNLSNNFLGDEQVSTLLPLVNLVEIDLSHNHLWDENIFREFTKFKKLIFFKNSHNEYKKIWLDQPFWKLRELYIDDNNTEEILIKAVQTELKILSAKDNDMKSILNVMDFNFEV